MAKRSKKKGAPRRENSERPAAPPASAPQSTFPTALTGAGLSLLLALVTFLVYWPSLKADFVYDAHIEFFQENFITNLSHLPDVLSLKVLGMNYQLGDRPGQLLYLMLIAAISGKDPFGYHLVSNLLHAANVALLVVLLLRLARAEIANPPKDIALKMLLAITATTLIFALHPLVVEPVSDVSYSSDLLVAFFSLLALLAATAFDPDHFRPALLCGSAGTFCAFASVASKESGVATAALLVVYWFLYRRRETKVPWLCFLGAAIVVTAAFLAARFLLAPPAPMVNSLVYLGGSFSQVFLIQPQLWIFMMGKIVWPTQLSADYTLTDATVVPVHLALTILAVIVVLQAWLAFKSRLGALGVAMYWLGLATVSNFIPLYRILGDRFYYLPLLGVSLQLLAFFLLCLKFRRAFWMILAPFLLAALPLGLLTLKREVVFASDFNLWTDTIEASPSSAIAHSNLGFTLYPMGRIDEAIDQLQQAVTICPDFPIAHYNLGLLLLGKGKQDEALAHLRKAIAVEPDLAPAYNSIGAILFQRGQLEAAQAEFAEALRRQPDLVEARDNLTKTQALLRGRAAQKGPVK